MPLRASTSEPLYLFQAMCGYYLFQILENNDEYCNYSSKAKDKLLKFNYYRPVQQHLSLTEAIDSEHVPALQHLDE